MAKGKPYLMQGYSINKIKPAGKSMLRTNTGGQSLVNKFRGKGIK